MSPNRYRARTRLVPEVHKWARARPAARVRGSFGASRRVTIEDEKVAARGCETARHPAPCGSPLQSPGRDETRAESHAGRLAHGVGSTWRQAKLGLRDQARD